MPTDTEIQGAITSELNIPDTDVVFPLLMPIWWGLYDDKTTYLKYLYTKKRAITYLMGKERMAINVVIGLDQLEHQQRFENLLDMCNEITKEINLEDPYASLSPISTALAIQGHSLQLLHGNINEFAELQNYMDLYYNQWEGKSGPWV
jgi:hypothetical protein